MAAMEGTKINGGRIRSLEILFRLAGACVCRERGTCRLAVGMTEFGVNERHVRSGSLRRGRTGGISASACQITYLLVASDSFAACARALAKLSIFLSTINAVTASLSAC